MAEQKKHHAPTSIHEGKAYAALTEATKRIDFALQQIEGDRKSLERSERSAVIRAAILEEHIKSARGGDRIVRAGMGPELEQLAFVAAGQITGMSMDVVEILSVVKALSDEGLLPFWPRLEER